MISSAAANTWGLSGPAFLALYLAVCALAASLGWLRWRSVFGPARRTSDPTPSMSAYKVAMLTGGPHLAVVASATKLHLDGALVSGSSPRSLSLGGDLPPESEQLDRDVYEAVRRSPETTTDALRRELATSPPVIAMADELERASLMADRHRAAVLRRELAILGGLLAIAGIARIAAAASGHPGQIAPLGAVAVCAVLATARLIRGMPYATGYGQDLLRRLRKRRRDRAVAPHRAESVTAVALFGAGALWVADPGTASALGVRREQAGAASGSHYSGCGSATGGWFGGGGGHGGGHGGGGGGGHAGGGHGGGHGCGGGH